MFSPQLWGASEPRCPRLPDVLVIAAQPARSPSFFLTTSNGGFDNQTEKRVDRTAENSVRRQRSCERCFQPTLTPSRGEPLLAACAILLFSFSTVGWSFFAGLSLFVDGCDVVRFDQNLQYHTNCYHSSLRTSCDNVLLPPPPLSPPVSGQQGLERRWKGRNGHWLWG